jgi:type IV pilus assembly protein PilM
MLSEHIPKGKKTFFEFFPPPRFLTMPAFGLNISDHSIKIMEIIHGSKMKVGKFGNEPIPDEVIKSVNINDRGKLEDILRKLKEKYDMSFIRVSLPEEKAYVFKVKVPKTENEEQIKNSIEFQLEDNVPISINEALFDYTFIPGDSNKNEIEVGVSVLPQKVVASYISIFKSVGLTPISFEIEAESIARSIIKKDDMETYMIVDYGRTRTGFSVVSRGVLRYTSTVEIGGEPLTRIIKKAGATSFKEAEKIKNEKGLIKDPENPELYMSLVNIVSALRDEINKRYIFWHTHKDRNGEVGEQIKKIFLVGGNSNLGGLEDYLSSSLKVKVERANVWNNVSLSDNDIPPINFGDSLSYASAIGLALRKFF